MEASTAPPPSSSESRIAHRSAARETRNLVRILPIGLGWATVSIGAAVEVLPSPRWVQPPVTLMPSKVITYASSTYTVPKSSNLTGRPRLRRTGKPKLRQPRLCPFVCKNFFKRQWKCASNRNRNCNHKIELNWQTIERTSNVFFSNLSTFRGHVCFISESFMLCPCVSASGDGSELWVRKWTAWFQEVIMDKLRVAATKNWI